MTLHISPPLLQPEEEMETVFDMEPSSTSSTPTSLVSHCLPPGGQVGGVGTCRSGLLQPQCGGAPAFRAHPGDWGGGEGPWAPSPDPAGLGPGQIAAVAVAEGMGRQKRPDIL